MSSNPAVVESSTVGRESSKLTPWESAAIRTRKNHPRSAKEIAFPTAELPGKAGRRGQEMPAKAIPYGNSPAAAQVC